MTKTHTGTFTQGQTAEWDITVNNTVTNTSTSGTTSVSDALPSGYTLSSYTASGWSCSGSTTVLDFQPGGCRGSSFVKIESFVNVPAASPASVSNTALAWGGGDLTHTNSGNAASGTDSSVPVVQVPASVTITAGATQSAGINTAFGTALTVVVKDAGGVTIPSYSPVTFTAPATGASLWTFSNSTNTINGTTNESGVVSETFTANGTSGGPYSVTATAGSASASPAFMLTNTTTPSLSVTRRTPARSPRGKRRSGTSR